MSTDLDPVVGNWYRQLDKGGTFVVVSFDEDEGIIEIQHLDGDLEEIDESAWFDMDLEIAEPPEDWTGPLNDVDADDLEYEEPEAEQTWTRAVGGSDEDSDDWEELERDELDEDESSDELYGWDSDDDR